MGQDGEGGEYKTKIALPIVRAQRGNRGIAKEKLDPVAEAAKPQWNHKK